MNIKKPNYWLTKNIWQDGSHTIGDGVALCNCFTTEALIFNEDPQKVYRCSICGAPAIDKLAAGEAFVLSHKITLEKVEEKERLWLISEI